MNNKMNNSKHPIFPMQGARHTSENPNEPTGQYAIGNDGFQFSGLTKREYFAAMALSGMAHGYSDAKQAAEMAIKFADELLDQLGNG